jgi:predicted dehydrogenase
MSGQGGGHSPLPGNRPIRMGVIGCGEIAQIMHLPYLQELPEFEIAALCDVSPTVVDAVGDRFRIAARYTDYRALLAEAAVDAVAVCTPDHATVAQAAAEQGKHLLVEKPLAFSPAEADLVIDAAASNRIMLMVGYMKRFDAAYEYASERIRALDSIRLVRMHDFAGDFTTHQSLYTLVRAPEKPDRAQQNPAEPALRAALGPQAEDRWMLYLSLLTLCTHDMSVLRGVFGQPETVESSAAIGDTGVVSLLRYGSGVACAFEADSNSSLVGWDEELVVYGQHEVISVAFPNPFIKHAETVVTVTASPACIPTTTTTPVSHDEAFRREWRHFAECIRTGREPRTGGPDARADLELLADVVRAIPAPTCKEALTA